MYKALILFTALFMAVTGQEVQNDETESKSWKEDGPILVEWKYRFSETSRDQVYGTLDKLQSFYDKFTDGKEPKVLINTWGFYSLDNSIKHTMLLRSHSALEKVMTRFDNETAIITELGDLRDLPTSDYYESGDIYNFAGEAADVQDIFPWAKIRARELTLNQFGPHVSGWIN